MAGRKRPAAPAAVPAKVVAAPHSKKTVEPDNEVEVVDRDADAEPEVDAVPGVDEELVDIVLPGAGDDDSADVTAEAHEGPETAPLAEPAEKGLARRDPLTLYVQEIRKIPLLSREEEHELAAKYYETGDLGLARRLVTANLRLVVKIAHEYRRAYRNLLDLVQEGNIGLMQAVRKYDPFRGVKLSSYAAWWIRAYILKFILNNWRLVKIGTTQAQRKLFFNLRKEKEKLEQLGFAPEHKLLAERLDVTEAEVAEMERRLDGADLSLDAPVSRDDEGGRSRLDNLEAAAGDRPDTLVENDEFRTLLRAKLEIFAKSLAGRDESLFRERWLSESPSTLQQIGDEFGISRERARQLEKRLLDKLRVYLEAELGTAVDIGAMRAED